MVRVIRNLLPIKRNYVGGFLLLTLIAIICLAFSLAGTDDFDFARREILLRRVGHELLLQSGDSTSRVLPVEKIASDAYQIGFEKEFTFQPESLVNITQRMLAKDPLANEYLINVLNCADGRVVYGFVLSNNKKDDIIACIGRGQPEACYKINITFKPKGIITAKNGYFLGSLTVLAFVGFLFVRSAKPKKTLPLAANVAPGLIPLGSLTFDPEGRKLIINGNFLDLTKTETRVLRIFALSPNETIERSRLQKEIWEDEGVIVGRSLDMFISKLRKKLEPDPSVRIVVIRGKGYKLEINT
ncbi:MAG TPA: winged helix-turn-helix domain-containing protein [Flavisolibacter sp.]|jgi:hypothetical protein|nr:winged helix-turn-helix domain-containing protein [Flavisolibacter sp.]